MLLKDIKDIFHKELHRLYPKEEVDSFFYQSIEHFLGLERFVLVLQPEMVLTKKEEQPLFETVAHLKLEKPLQYILGKAHFMDLEFVVNEHVLIPRPETEELVQWILSDCQVERSQDLNILDIGTGSGCIAIALAKYLSGANVVAMDISEKALEVAQENARNNKVDVSFIKENVLDPELVLEPKFDIIVSNPPYVRENEKQQMKNNVKAFEPHVALFVSDYDPLKFYKSIVRLTEKSLRKGGELYFEVNQYLSQETWDLLKAHNFSEIELRKDIFGNDRMLKAVKK
ncbi:peptide chain release factor N(5)-glutamine methyltransferase [Muricauda sp. JGD-17]|uniref:Release factor glutamine methyltransferase n=1 Tax=Flagellimonas ochracea TaxID=2696472 RepID=A0A964WWD6_9FLAO|nr:peptide chain release factor N(5)-glutamine methyltransferase [Allomuricauda ochracea]NAY90697.1 peptide chain release factor N(5)-glutamine methyltransferase [Allomuricauda ochracea]